MTVTSLSIRVKIMQLAEFRKARCYTFYYFIPSYIRIIYIMPRRCGGHSDSINAAIN